MIHFYEDQRLGKSPLSNNPQIAVVQQGVEALLKPIKRREGQGRGLTYDERVAVEVQAMRVIADKLQKMGFTNIKDTSTTESYDFSAENKNGPRMIEVKGTTSTNAETFLLTAAELNLHRVNNGATILALVSDIDLKRNDSGPTASGRVAEIVMLWDLNQWDIEPTAFKATRKAMLTEPKLSRMSARVRKVRS